MAGSRPFAIVTGASTGIGFELAKRCAKEGYDLLIAADEREIEKAAASLRNGSTEVEAVQADLATTEGVDKLYAAARGRQVDALLANAGSRPCVPGPGIQKSTAGHRYQCHRHGLKNFVSMAPGIRQVTVTLVSLSSSRSANESEFRKALVAL